MTYPAWGQEAKCGEMRGKRQASITCNRLAQPHHRSLPHNSAQTRRAGLLFCPDSRKFDGKKYTSLARRLDSRMYSGYGGYGTSRFTRTGTKFRGKL